MTDLTTTTTDTDADTVKKMMMVMKVSSSSSIVAFNKYITEDLCLNILLRLPLKSIFKFRCVSKLWFLLLSNPSFFITRLRLNPCLNTLPWIIIYQLDSPDDHYLPDKPPLDLDPSSVLPPFSIGLSPNLQSQYLSDHDGFSFSFLPEEKKLYLLTSSNGLILCSTSKYYQLWFYVCNPLTKTWVVIPAPPSFYTWALNGFICESTSQTSTSYMVVRVPRFKIPSTKFSIEIFSSDVGEWITHKVSCPQQVTWGRPFSSNVVINNGFVYWIEGENRIVAYDIKKNIDSHRRRRCRLIELPEERGDDSICTRCLGESEGSVYYAQIQKQRKTFSVWMLKEDQCSGEECVWNLVHTIGFKDMLADQKDFWFRDHECLVDLINPLAFNPLDRNVVIFCCYLYILAYNIQTRKSEVLQRPPPYLNFHYSFYTGFRVLPFLVTPMPTPLPSSSQRDSY